MQVRINVQLKDNGDNYLNAWIGDKRVFDGFVPNAHASIDVEVAGLTRIDPNAKQETPEPSMTVKEIIKRLDKIRYGAKAREALGI